MNSKSETWRTVSRVVFPGEDNDDALALYLDFGRQVGVLPDDPALSHRKRRKAKEAFEDPYGRIVEYEGSDIVAGRHQLRLEPGRRVSLGTYFNAFPAAYWWRWTDVRTVRLVVTVSGHADILIYKSNARGVLSGVDARINQEGIGTFTFDLSLEKFGDGGWYWFDLIGHEDGARLEGAQWQVADDPIRPGTLSIGVTTLNRAADCKKLVETISGSEDLRAVLDVTYIVDQGSQPVENEPGWDAVAAELGSQLQVVRQVNLGGSGGFARGMYETVSKGVSAYHLLLDDDVSVEPEAIVRAVTFASHCRKPTIVGGHMFDYNNRSKLHAYAEGIDTWKWFWGPHPGLDQGHDLAKNNLRATPILHRRLDAVYNGWWMTLIPVEIIDEIGTSLPVFIKWDDAEYGVRAAAHGYPTVSMPGVCVWHVSWADKDDSVDWQAYYHERNRLVVALLHSPHPRGGGLLRDSFVSATQQAISMQYYAQYLRNEAIRDVLRGPGHLHETIATKLSELRAAAARFDDAQYAMHPEAFPAAENPGSMHNGYLPVRPRIRQAPLWMLKAGIKQGRSVDPSAHEIPQVALSHADGRWWTLAQFDSAVVTKADGSGMAFYRRRPELLRQLMRESVELHLELRRNWDALAQQYRDALGDITSMKTWRETFGLDDGASR